MPGVLDSRHVSALLMMQWAKARGFGEESPLDEWPIELARVVNEEGGRSERNVELVKLLAGLEKVEVRPVTIRLLSGWERLAIAKWARVEEYLEGRSRRRRLKWRKVKKSKAINRERMERIRGGNKALGNGQVLASVEELERLAIKAEGEKDKMAKLRSARYWNQAEKRRREIEMARKKNEEVGEVHESEEEGGIMRGSDELMSGWYELAKQEKIKKEKEERPEVEIEVVRVGPNPRVVVCRYKLCAEELVVKLRVDSNKFFVKGMRIRMREQEGEEWEYRGTLPRHKGRW
jgi:hypothetical protein